MATDLSLLIFESGSIEAICVRWLGGDATYMAALQELSRPPRLLRAGLECWSPVTPDDVWRIAKHSYADGATPEEINELSSRFPASHYVWTLERDY